MRVHRQPQPAPGSRARGPGVNSLRSTPGCTTSTRAGLGVVQLDQLARLDVGVGDQHVGGLDHLLLADQPGDGLGGVALGERGVLDLGHGVHRVHQRHAPAVAGQRADLPGEPVVRVDRVVVAGQVAGLGPHHLTGERAQLAGQLALGHPLERTRVDVADQDVVGDLHDRRQGRGRRAREDVHRDVAAGQLPGELDDVDVHAARVPGAGLVQRGGVQADHRDATHTRVVPPWLVRYSSGVLNHVRADLIPPAAHLVEWRPPPR